MDRLTPNSPIDGIPSATWNQFYDTKKKVDQLLAQTNKQSSRGVQNLRVLVRNTTDADVDSLFPILELGDPVLTTDDREIVVFESMQFKGLAPSSDTKTYAIIQGPIPAGEFRSGVILGPTWCIVDVTDDAHTHAKPGDVPEHLVSGTTGLPFIWRQRQDEDDTTGLQYAAVFMGGGGSADRRTGDIAMYTYSGSAGAGSADAPGSGTGDVYVVYTDGSTALYEGGGTLLNPFQTDISGSGTCTPVTNDPPPSPEPSPDTSPSPLMEVEFGGEGKPVGQFGGDAGVYLIVAPPALDCVIQVPFGVQCSDDGDGTIELDMKNVHFTSANGCEVEDIDTSPEPSPSPEL
jgi:hypothetical protein